MSSLKWEQEVIKTAKRFCVKHFTTYSYHSKKNSGLFEIGCLMLVERYYRLKGFSVEVKGLKNGNYKFLTSPNGNPNNFSYIILKKGQCLFELRQQIRIRSHKHEDITFTPDFVVITEGVKIQENKDPNYAGGKRKFFCVDAKDVIAAHECKSLPPFPELFVSFVGMYELAHEWVEIRKKKGSKRSPLANLAPTLFVGGSSNFIHNRIADGLMDVYDLNIITGLHEVMSNTKLKKLKTIYHYEQKNDLKNNENPGVKVMDSIEDFEF